MRKARSVTVKQNYVLSVTFDDGLSGEVSMADRLFGPVFEPLKDPLFFARAELDSFGAICWPNGADIAPDALYHKIAQQKVPAFKTA